MVLCIELLNYTIFQKCDIDPVIPSTDVLDEMNINIVYLENSFSLFTH